ncbi:MAG: YnfA family protein [Armatimonadetes bacterium]|nr:YnfA family protein [Armatimonadota bacterium]
MKAIAWYALAALAEIGGCFSFWAWLKLNKSGVWVLPGLCSLAFFAFVLTRIETPYAGRAYAAYGGIYIIMSLLWLWGVEKTRPDKWDVFGATLCVLGTLVILLAPRSK